MAPGNSAKNPRGLIQVHVLLLLVLVLYSTAAYSSLPARYAVHFNFKGEVDRWAEKGSIEYWLLPGIAALVGTLILVSLRLPPRWYNFPQKEQVDRWPEERRTPIYTALKEMLVILAIVIDVMMLGIQAAVVQSANGHPSRWIAAVFAVAVLIPVVAISYLIRISRHVKRTESEFKLTGWMP